MNVTQKVLVSVTVAGLAIDAYVHLALARTYDPVSASISQGWLFRLEAAAAIVAAVLLLIRPNRLTAGFAAIVAGSGLIAVLLFRYVDVGALGPFPNMYEPLWYTKKVVTTIAQAVATVTALILVLQLRETRGSASGEK
jgi:hypothetical protein